MPVVRDDTAHPGGRPYAMFPRPFGPPSSWRGTALLFDGIIRKSIPLLVGAIDKKMGAKEFSMKLVPFM